MGPNFTIGTEPHTDKVGHHFADPKPRGWPCKHPSLDRAFDPCQKQRNDGPGKITNFNGPHLLPDWNGPVPKD